MTCHHITIGGTTAIVCMRGQRPKKFTMCARPGATLLCDWKIAGGTCDKPVCARCATHVGLDRDLCREHGIAWGVMLSPKP
jgi:hypothetical protein